MKSWKILNMYTQWPKTNGRTCSGASSAKHGCVVSRETGEVSWLCCSSQEFWLSTKFAKMLRKKVRGWQRAPGPEKCTQGFVFDFPMLHDSKFNTNDPVKFGPHYHSRPILCSELNTYCTCGTLWIITKHYLELFFMFCFNQNVTAAEKNPVFLALPIFVTQQVWWSF